MRIEVLGHVEAIGDEPLAIGGPTQRRLLGVLALHHDDVVSVDRLIDATWPGDDAPARAERNVHSYVHRLRSSLDGAGDRIETVGAGYRLRLDSGALDLDAFDDLAATARRHADGGDAVQALASIDEALALWHGRPFGEFADEPWAVGEVARAVETNVGIRELRAELLLELGRPADVVADMDALVREHPYREGPRALQMQALYHAGRQAEALRVFQAFRRLLVDEVGLEPSKDLVELDRRIATGELEASGGVRERTIGAYVLGDRIGEGAFAVVYRATQPTLGRDVAIKVVRAELANRPEFVRRFAAEAQMVAGIEHPNVVPLYDYWREPDRAYLVMRLMSGGTLEARLDTGPMDAGESAAVVEQVAGALAAAHDKGVVHRDVKPENIMFDADGRAYLTDFGIALEAAERAHPEAALSEGSPLYASPEQLRREPVGPEADVHALGVVAFTMLVGHAPWVWSHDEAERLRRQLEEPIPTVRDIRPELPESVDIVLGTATAKRPEDRYPTTLAFAAAFEAALAGEPEIQVVRPVGERINPYKGLRAFDETDAGDFYGRDRLVDELVESLNAADERLLAVVGPSGSGKSSAVRAGLLPALRRGRVPGSAGWFTTTMTPGTHPYEALETALLRIAVNPPGSLLEQLLHGPRGILRGVRRVLPDDGTNLLVVIDQFEELFTNDVDPAVRGQFLDALVAATSEPGTPLRVVLTLRADFFDRPLRHPGFAPVLKRRTVAVAPLAADELEHAIVDPAVSAGVDFEPGVVARIVADVTSQPGALPLLQYALTEMFDRAGGDRISEADYDAVGGITGSLARSADELWIAAEPSERAAVRRLFQRLVNLGEGVQDTRRRVLRSELGDDPAMAAAIGRYGRARLLTFDRDPATREPTVEVAHEALLQQWPRLRNWLDEDRNDLRTLHMVGSAADDWIASDRDPGGLARGGRLEAANDLAARHGDWLNDRERGWIEASTRAADAEAAERAARIERDRQQNRRLRTLLVVASVLLVVAIVAGVVAFAQQRQSEENAREADLRRVVAQSQASIDEDPALALLLALEAFRIEPSNETLGAIQRAGAGSPTDWLGDVVNGSTYMRVQFLSDGLLVGLTDSAIEIWDLDVRTVVREVPLEITPVDLDIGAGGELIAVGGEGGAWVVHRAEDLSVVARGEVDGTVSSVELDESGDVVALGSSDGAVHVRGLTDPTLDRAYRPLDADGEPIPDPVEDLAVRSDGRFLAAAWGLGAEVQQFDLTDAEAVGDSLARSDGAYTVHYAGDRLYTLFHELAVFDSDTGELIGEPFNRNDALDGNAAIEVLADGTVRISDTARVETIGVDDARAVRDYESGASFQAAVSPNRDIVAIGTTVGLSLWALDGAGTFVDVVVPAAPERSGFHAISASGHMVVQGGNAGDNVPTRVWDLSGAEPVMAHEVEPGFGTRQSGNDAITYRAYGEPVRDRIEFARYEASTNAFASLMTTVPVTFGAEIPIFSPNGSLFLHPWNNGEGVLDVYDAATGDRLERLTHIKDAAPPSKSRLHVPRYSPDGTMLVQPTLEEYVGVYDPATWQLVELLEPDAGFQQIVFMPDGERVITLSPDGLEVRLTADLGTVIAGPVPVPGDPEFGRVLEITSDGRWLKAALRGGAQLWDAETLEPVGSFFPDSLLTWGATLAADTNQLATTNDELETLIWNVELTEWPDLACLAAGRNLTQDEWEQFGPEGDYHVTCDRWPSG